MSNGDHPGEDLAYIKYSAKEILFHLTSKVESLQSEINFIRVNMVSRDELTQARRWAVSATLTAIAAMGGVIGLIVG